MKRIFLTFIVFISLFSTAKADEGMWLPYSLDGRTVAEMQALGCKLTPEQIFDLNNTSLKDAILQFGGGCTGEVISPNGLILTNHHCGIGQVQAHSSVENDYLTHGFWAYKYADELPNEGLSVLFLHNVKDVTEEVLKGVTDDMSEEDRNIIIASNSQSIEESLSEANKTTVRVESFYHGNQYIVFEYKKYEDVRLVACPPWGIGKYGADTDNWTWPRHKGDFCMFRIYTAPDGSPAEYSPENVPMKAKKYLPISMKGVKEGDYAMILGYPGSTDRYSSSQDVELNMNYYAPAIVDARTVKLNTYRKYMDADPVVFIKYASKQASVSNYWKYYIGQKEQLKRNKVVEKKQATEKEFEKWVNANPERKKKYGNVLKNFEESMEISKLYQAPSVYYREAGLSSCEAISFVRTFARVSMAINNKADKETVREMAQGLIPRVEAFFEDYDYELDKAVAINMLNLFYKQVPEDLRPDMINKIGAKNDGDFTKFVEKAFEKSFVTTPEKVMKWIENPKSIDKDPFFLLRSAIVDKYNEVIYPNLMAANEIKAPASRLYMEALMAMNPDKVFYPDANFTMRLTYGTVEDYEPRDAVVYDYKTNMDGVMDKYIPDNWEFDLPDDVIDLYNRKDYGRYADENGDLIVNFITTNDITGGNSGSPVIDGEGNLIGIAFDGNWEAMSGDISFENKVQRTICVDARFFLWTVDKVGKAQNLIDEMEIIW